VGVESVGVAGVVVELEPLFNPVSIRTMSTVAAAKNATGATSRAAHARR
jgi:hypothetical protein